MKTMDNKKAKIIAVCGKGGVGKTSISASIIKLLSEKNSGKILAIDADPAVGLAYALNIRVKKTIDDVRNEIIKRIQEGKGGDKKAMISMIDYEVFNAIEERDNVAFLAIGRPETEGCYCQLNEMLKDIIKSIADHFDYIIIDGEAGIEQVNRRVMEEVGYLLLVSDASARGINVVHEIKDVAEKAVNYKKVTLVLNRIRDKDEADKVMENTRLDLAGWIPEDDLIRSFDIEGKSIMELHDSKALNAVREVTLNIGL